MKKFLSLLLAMAMTLSLAACGGSPAQDTPSSEEPADDTQQTEETSGIDASALYAIGGGATGGTHARDLGFRHMGAVLTKCHLNHSFHKPSMRGELTDRPWRAARA